MKNFPPAIFYLLHYHFFTGAFILATQLPIPASLHSSQNLLMRFSLGGRVCRDESPSRKCRGSLLWTWLQLPLGQALRWPLWLLSPWPSAPRLTWGCSTGRAEERPQHFKVTKHTPTWLTLLCGWFSCVGYHFGFRQVAWSLVPSPFPDTSKQVGPGSLLPALGIGIPSYGCISMLSLSPHLVIWEAQRCPGFALGPGSGMMDKTWCPGLQQLTVRWERQRARSWW